MLLLTILSVSEDELREGWDGKEGGREGKVSSSLERSRRKERAHLKIFEESLDRRELATD